MIMMHNQFLINITELGQLHLASMTTGTAAALCGCMPLLLLYAIFLLIMLHAIAAAV
jgi:hypothetical protein